ncbi:ATP-binding protein [Nocardioides sp. GCM10028917]|uniref:ATP-binding protein n=1 Tax=Nocardioides sp. GCM10028917 TaxID=3273408 RepID=UPI003618A303
MNDALHALHHRAGWPSLRNLASDAGCSHTTVSHVFSSPKPTRWGVIELLVEAMGGDTAEFHDLWLSASSSGPSTLDKGASAIAGRKTELASVRRHLESGAGLLLVTGEAGIGKTKLVSTAVALVATDVFVATGSCLPLSSDAPLMPPADALRSVYESDGGRWLGEALSKCPPYVLDSLTLLVPELAREDVPALPTRDTWAGQRLFAAVEATLRALAAGRRLGLLIEDLHWADTATLDLIEHLAGRGTDIPVLGTWRVDDPTIDRSNLKWFTRVRRSSSVRSLPLAALSPAETCDQLALLTGQAPAAGFVEGIFRRTQGQPLFTEQLAADVDANRELPALLADLLDDRLGRLTGSAWAVARALGAADRPVTAALLAQISGLSAEALSAGLHDLDARRLLGTSRDEVILRHPLLAEAIRRRLVAGEVESLHAAVAGALAATPDPEPAEVARHWQSAGNRDKELQWRIRAAQVAHERYAMRQEVAEWRRVLELWPEGQLVASEPPTRRYDVLVSLMTTWTGVDVERPDDVAADCLALVPDLPPLEAAMMLYLAGDHYADSGQRELGLELLHRAIAIFEDCPPNEGHVRAIKCLGSALREAGRNQDAARAASRGIEVSAELRDPAWHRRMLMEKAWHDVRAGDIAPGMARARQAAAMSVDPPDPRGEASVLSAYTDLLLLTAGDVDEVVTVGQQALDSAAVWTLESYGVSAIRYNMAVAMRRSGQVRRAAALIEPYAAEVPTKGQWGGLHVERARLHMLQGHLEAAQAFRDVLRASRPISLDELLEDAEAFAEIDVWTCDHEAGFANAVALADEVAPTEAALSLGPHLTLAARSAADGPASDRDARLRRLLAVREACVVDPFAIRPVPADGKAWTATWTAEISRLSSRPSVELWITAASEWDRLSRPHDSAYCSWRAAQFAVSTGQAATAAKLLRRASRDAAEHVPLLKAVRATTPKPAREPG